MIRRALVLALVVALFVPAALADEGDAETRFHDAYVLEVIDGKIAEAAKRYLDLLQDERVEPRLRDEARFRFAVCTVLLGRPDEARMQLAAIAANERVSQPLRERAKAYLDSISTLGVGTELERKLNALVFDLGRTSPFLQDVPAYRDFEIIGPPAVPFLEKLLQHEDVDLRRHAFRILIRLGEEDMVARWTPKIGFGEPGLGLDFLQGYLSRHPEETRRLEAKLLAQDDETLRSLLSMIQRSPSWSLDFARALVPRPRVRSWGFVYLSRVGTGSERWVVFSACIQGADEDASRLACSWALQEAEGPPDEMVEVLWPPVLERATSTGQGWSTGAPAGSLSGNLDAWARRLPTPLLLSSLERLVALGETWPEEKKGNPLREGLAGLVAGVLDGRELDAVRLDAYEALVKRWVAAVAPTLEPRRPAFQPNARVSPLRNLIQRLPEARARSLVRWLFEGPAHEKAAWFANEVGIARPEDVALLVEAVKAVDPADRDVLVQQLPHFRESSPSEAIARAEVEALPGLLRLTSVATMEGKPGRSGFWRSLEHVPGRLPDDSLVKALRALFATAVEMEDESPKALFDHIVDFRAQTADALRRRAAFLVRYVLPALHTLSEDLPLPFRHAVLDKVFLTLRNRYPFEEGDRERLAAYVLGAIDDVERKDLSVLAAHPDLFPLERWIPRVEADAIDFRLEIRTADVDPAVKALAADPAQVNDAVLALIVGYASPQVGRPVVEAMLTGPDAAVRRRALRRLREPNGYPASPAALESALARALGEDPTDLDDVARLAAILAVVQPSERLLPAAELLLASEDGKDRLRGIDLANRLGSEALVPALARLLDSMDADLRERARKAISAIREVERFKEEVQNPR